MVKIAYLDCPTGIAGDMCLGALVDVGVPLKYLIDQLGRLGIAQEYKLWTELVHRNSQRATKFHVDLVLNATETTHADAFTTFDHEVHQRHVHSATEGATVETFQRNVSTSYPHPHSHSHPPSHSPVEMFQRNISTTHPPIHPSTHPYPPVRHLPDIEQLILNAHLPPRAEAWSLAVFRKLAEAEGAVHGVSPEQVHFHEVGATDALVDIIGTCLGLDWLGIDALYCSALPTGGGRIRAAHGRLPVPTPAVLKLFEMGQVPIYSNGIEKELVTPTGAAIATTLVTQFGPPPPMILHRVGLGAGSQDLSLPNILRLWIGEGGEAEGDASFVIRHSSLAEDEELSAIQNSKFKIQNSPAEIQNPKSKIQNPTLPIPHSPLPTSSLQTIAVLETQIDDLNPQAIAYVLEVLLEAGALDVFTQAIGMKKSRPGVLLTVICQPEDVDHCEAILFRETTTLGIRRSLQERQILPRELQTVETAYGPVRVKVAWAEGRDRPPTNVQPEYEDCAELARSQNQPWREVHQAALAGWYQQNASGFRRNF